MIGKPNLTLSAVIALETMKALRAGMELENVIATLIQQAEVLQMSLPVVNAVVESRRLAS